MDMVYCRHKRKQPPTKWLTSRWVMSLPESGQEIRQAYLFLFNGEVHKTNIIVFQIPVYWIGRYEVLNRYGL